MKQPYHDSKMRPPQTSEIQAIGERVRDLRIARGLSMHAVQQLGGPSIDTQHQVESGLIKRVNIKTFAQLANVFKIRVMEFGIVGDSEIEQIAAIVCNINATERAALRSQLERKVRN